MPLDATIPGMRDRLIHDYEVDVELLLITVRRRIPEVEPCVRAQLHDLPGETEHPPPGD